MALQFEWDNGRAGLNLGKHSVEGVFCRQLAFPQGTYTRSGEQCQGMDPNKLI